MLKLTRVNTLTRCILLSSLCLSGAVFAGTVVSQTELQPAPASGWAGQSGGTTGGSKADSDHIFTVANHDQLMDALKSAKKAPSIIQVKGLIDISNGKAYTDFNDQKERGQFKIPSNTTLIGITPDAGFINGNLILKNVDNVIVRNVTIETPVDVQPHYEEGDGWNAEWDGITATSATHIWVDHVTITDGHFTDDRYIQKNGEEYVQHDGAFDIKRGSDYVTVSYSLFKNHDKTMLIGHSDKNAQEDQDKLHITLHDNVFDNIVQRTPRVRFGHVHAYNNLFVGHTSKDKPYHYLYSFGLGVNGSIISEANVFNIPDLNDPCSVVKVWSPSGQMKDASSVVNGKKLDLAACSIGGQVTWMVPYVYQVKNPAQVAGLAGEAGSAKLKL